MNVLTIITVCKDNVGGLKKTFDNILNQTSSEFNYVVVDGNSSDGSRNLILNYEKHFATHGIQFRWISETDQGIYDAMNKGIMLADSLYTIFMNSGDLFYENDVVKKIIERVVRDKNGVDVYYGKTFCVGCEEKSFFMPFFIVEQTKKMTRMPTKHQGFFIKTALLKQRPYDTSFKIIADFEWCMYAFYSGKVFKYLDWTVCSFDMSGISSTNLTEKYREATKARKRYNCADGRLIYCMKLCVWHFFEKTGICRRYW